MIAKIGRGSNLYGALAYNQLKVEKENGQVLYTNKIIETTDGSYAISQLLRSFEPYLLVNRKTEKPILHISLNPDPKDKVSDEQFEELAQKYMQKMGYAEQPFVVFKHTDIDRTHIHIVSVCVDEEGRKICDKFEKRRSMDVCRELEKEYCLSVATEKKQNPQNQIFNPVDYNAGDIKSQMASVIRHLPKYYKFEGFGTYNALLSLFNITAEEVKGEYNGISRRGLAYFALNDKGEKASNPFKASLFGKSAGLSQLQSHFEQSRIKLKDSSGKIAVKSRIESIMKMALNESEFKKKLLEEGINVVVRRNTEGRIYGITFIDHKFRCVCNGSELSKNLSANSFNDWWNSDNKPENPAHKISASKKVAIMKTEIGQSPNTPDFLSKENMPHTYEENSFDVMGGLLPQVQTDDQEEQAFANRMKRRIKRRRL